MKANKIMLFSAVIFGLLAAFGVYWYINSIEKNLDNTVYAQIIVPKQDIKANTKLTRDMFQYKEIPVDYVHPNAVTNPEEIDGAITKSILIADEQLLEGKLVKQNQFEDGLSYQIKEGYRALTIPINVVSGLSGLVKPGDSVDIIVTIEDNQTISTFVLQNILVLAADNTLERKTGSAPADLERKTLTLEVKPTEAPKLVLASEQGSLRLLLRSPVDKEIPWVPQAKLETFIQNN
ncbi:MAG: Flp pilus assembly protein CpaB [Bacillota bacterium]|nr:Flp pilus assembly protein CpaB [Bacillota bacterium]